MSRRLWVITIVIIAVVAVVIALSFVTDLRQTSYLSVVVLVCVALAIVALQYLVVNPSLLESAKKEARRYCEAGQIIDPGLKRVLCNRLSKAPKDPEAARLKTELEKLPTKNSD